MAVVIDRSKGTLYTAEAADWSARPVEVDVPIQPFEPRPGVVVAGAPVLPYRPDTVVDGWATEAAVIRAASVRGYAHRFSRKNQPRQDDLALGLHEPSGTIIVAVADGVSQAARSHLGASVVCRYAVEWTLAALDKDRDLEWEELASGAAWALVDFGHRVLGLSEDPKAASVELATTMVVALAAPDSEGLLVQVLALGDSGVWLLEDGTFDRLSGGKDAEADFLSSAVSALPWVPASPKARSVGVRPGAVLLVGTDGFGDPLGSGKGLVGQLFAKELASPPLALRFAHLLDFSRETFDDDRTLVAIWPKPRPKEVPNDTGMSSPVSEAAV